MTLPHPMASLSLEAQERAHRNKSALGASFGLGRHENVCPAPVSCIRTPYQTVISERKKHIDECAYRICRPDNCCPLPWKSINGILFSINDCLCHSKPAYSSIWVLLRICAIENTPLVAETTCPAIPPAIYPRFCFLIATPGSRATPFKGRL